MYGLERGLFIRHARDWAGPERARVTGDRLSWRWAQAQMEKGCREFFQRPGLEVQVLYRGEDG